MDARSARRFVLCRQYSGIPGFGDSGSGLDEKEPPGEASVRLCATDGLNPCLDRDPGAVWNRVSLVGAGLWIVPRMRASDIVQEREREAGHLFFVPIAGVVWSGSTRWRSLRRTSRLRATGRAGQPFVGTWICRRCRRIRAILTLLEIDAFHQIHQAWRALGYPSDSLVPFYAIVIGVSGDTPQALASLAGILVNQGVRYHPWSASSNCILRKPRLLRPS